MLNKYLNQVKKQLIAIRTDAVNFHDALEEEFYNNSHYYFLEAIRKQALAELSAEDAEKVVAYIDEVKEYEKQMQKILTSLRKSMNMLEDLREKSSKLVK